MPVEFITVMLYVLFKVRYLGLIEECCEVGLAREIAEIAFDNRRTHSNPVIHPVTSRDFSAMTLSW